MSEPIEVQYIEVAGRSIAAVHAICPECEELDLNMTFDTSKKPWEARCTMGHTWTVPEPS